MKAFFVCLTLAALATTAQAQVANNSLWSDGKGNNTRVQVADLNPNDPGVLVTFVDATGFSGATSGSAATGSTSDKPKCQNSNTGTTAGGTEFRIMGGKLYKKVGGKWVVQREVKRKSKTPKPKTRAVGGTFSIGQQGTSLPGGKPPQPL